MVVALKREKTRLLQHNTGKEREAVAAETHCGLRHDILRELAYLSFLEAAQRRDGGLIDHMRFFGRLK